jgi:hypothetical protein
VPLYVPKIARSAPGGWRPGTKSPSGATLTNFRNQVLGGVGMKMWPLVLVALLAISASPSGAQSTTSPPRERVAGTIDRLAGDELVVAERDGPTQHVRLSATVKIYAVEKRRLSDIKPGEFLASGGVRGTDGKIHAVEVRIFPEALRGPGYQRPWNVKPQGVMTNATVGTVSQTDKGGVVHVTYKGGESEYTVGPEVPILAYVPGDRSLLKPGAAVLMLAQKMPDGNLSTDRVTAEKNGVKPPM